MKALKCCDSLSLAWLNRNPHDYCHTALFHNFVATALRFYALAKRICTTPRFLKSNLVKYFLPDRHTHLANFSATNPTSKKAVRSNWWCNYTPWVNFTAFYWKVFLYLYLSHLLYNKKEIHLLYNLSNDFIYMATPCLNGLFSTLSFEKILSLSDLCTTCYIRHACSAPLQWTTGIHCI